MSESGRRPRAPRGAAWDEIRASQEHLHGALREAARAVASFARLLASLRPPADEGASNVPDRTLGALIGWLEGLGAAGDAKASPATADLVRKAKDEALDAILSVLVDEVERIDDDDDPERFKERRDALTSIIGILVRQKSDAPREPARERVRRVPVE